MLPLEEIDNYDYEVIMSHYPLKNRRLPQTTSFHFHDIHFLWETNPQLYYCWRHWVQIFEKSRWSCARSNLTEFLYCRCLLQQHSIF